MSRSRKRKPKNGPAWWPCPTVGKRGYATKLDALTIAARTAWSMKPQRAYQCPHCDRFHLTGQPKRNPAGR